MTREHVFSVIKKNILDILFDLDPALVVEGVSLKELGANSIDRAEVVAQTMEDLSLKLSLVELGGISNISELADAFFEKTQVAVTH